MQINGTLTEDGASATLTLRPQDTAVVTLSVAEAESFVGRLLVERSADGAAWLAVHAEDGTLLDFTGTGGAPLEGEVFEGLIKHTGLERKMQYRVRAVGVDAESDAAVYALADVQGDILEVVLRDSLNRPLLSVRDDGGLVVERTLYPFDLGFLATYEDLVTSDAGPTAVDIGVYHARLTTSGSEGAEDVAIGDGTGAIVGQRKLVTLVSLGDAADSVALDHANLASAAGAALAAATLDAEGAFVLLEWNGTAWQVVYSGDATITEA